MNNIIQLYGYKLCQLALKSLQNHDNGVLDTFIYSLNPNISPFLQQIDKSHYYLFHGEEAVKHFIFSSVHVDMGKATSLECYQLGCFILSDLSPHEKDNSELFEQIKSILRYLDNKFAYLLKVYEDHMLHVSVLNYENTSADGCSNIGSIDTPKGILFYQNIFLFTGNASSPEKELFHQLSAGLLHKYDLLGGDISQLFTDVLQCFDKSFEQIKSNKKDECLIDGVSIGLMDEAYRKRLAPDSISLIQDDEKLLSIVKQILSFVAQANY